MSHPKITCRFKKSVHLESKPIAKYIFIKIVIYLASFLTPLKNKIIFE